METSTIGVTLERPPNATNKSAVISSDVVLCRSCMPMAVAPSTRFAVSPQDAHEVELLLPAYVEGLLEAGDVATAKKLRNRFQTLHWNAGGWPSDLTTQINSCLLEFAMRDRLAPSSMYP